MMVAERKICDIDLASVDFGAQIDPYLIIRNH